MTLRERERQLQEEVKMRRMLDAYTQRQMYELVRGEQELKRINRVQLEELARLSAIMRKTESKPSAEGASFASETVDYTHCTYLLNLLITVIKYHLITSLLFPAPLPEIGTVHYWFSIIELAPNTDAGC